VFGLVATAGGFICIIAAIFVVPVARAVLPLVCSIVCPAECIVLFLSFFD